MRHFFTLLLLSVSLHAAPWSPATVDGFTPSLMRGLIEYWEFNEASAGTAATGRVAGIVLTDFNTVARTTNGKLSGGITNNAAGKWLESSDSSLTNQSTNFTVSAWFSPTVTAASQVVACRDNTTIRMWSVGHSTVGPSLFFSYYTNLSTQTTLRLTNATVNVFRHLVGVKNGADVLFYVDGSFVAGATNQPFGTFKSTQKFVVGSLDVNRTVTLNGILDELGLWDRALEPKEITQLYNLGKARRFPFNSGP